MSYDTIVQDVAVAAAIACDGYFDSLTIKVDINAELSVGDTLDAEQIPVLLMVLSGELGESDGYEPLSREYNVINTEAKFANHANPYDVYWDEIIQVLEQDNPEDEETK